MNKDNDKGIIGVLVNFVGNGTINNLEVSTTSCPTGLEISISNNKNISDSNIQVMIRHKLKDSYVQPLVINVKCSIDGVSVNKNLALPIVIMKFIDYYDVTIEEFTAMWLEFSSTSGDETQRFDSIMYNPLESSKSIMDFLKKLGGLLTGMGFKVFSPSNTSNYHEIEACGILIYDDNKMIPVLIQASFLPSFTTEFRFSIRTKNKNYTHFSNLTLDIFSYVKFFVNPK